MNKIEKCNLFETEVFFNIINIFSVPSEQFNVSLLGVCGIDKL